MHPYQVIGILVSFVSEGFSFPPLVCFIAMLDMESVTYYFFSVHFVVAFCQNHQPDPPYRSFFRAKSNAENSRLNSVP